MSIAMIRVAPAISANAPRQPVWCIRAASGDVASKVPIPPIMNSHELMAANFSAGNQRAMATIEPMRPAAQPTPMSALAVNSSVVDVAPAKRNAPATASISRPDIVARGPKRSSRIPVGICITAKVRKKTPVTAPNCVGEIARSAISSGAMTALETRKN